MTGTHNLFGSFNFQENINPEEAERALRHFIWSIEKGWHFSKEPIGNDLRVSPELLIFIAKGLKKQYEKGDISAWTGKKSGRPSIPSDDFLSMLAWYRFHFDQRFNSLPKSGENGRWNKIAESFTTLEDVSSKEAIKAAALSDRANGINDIDSETSVKSAISEFQKTGLEKHESLHHNIHNQIKILTFCEIILGLSPEAAYKHGEEILKFWNNINDKKKARNKINNSP